MLASVNHGKKPFRSHIKGSLKNVGNATARGYILWLIGPRDDDNPVIDISTKLRAGEYR